MTITSSTLALDDALHAHSSDTITLRLPGLGTVVLSRTHRGLSISIGGY